MKWYSILSCLNLKIRKISQISEFFLAYFGFKFYTIKLKLRRLSLKKTNKTIREIQHRSTVPFQSIHHGVLCVIGLTKF